MPKKLVKQDINFLENPIWFQDGRIGKKLLDERGAFIWEDKEGFIFKTGYKLPTRIDGIFLLYLLKISQSLEWKDEISLTRYRMLKACNLNTTGPYWYERLEDSLERWKMVGIRFEGTFYDGNNYSSMNFGIIDSWDVNRDTRELRIWFSKRWLTLIRESKYYKMLDFDELKSLHSPLALRLYEILIKNFQNRSSWQIYAKNLAAKIPIQDKYAAHIVKKITGAVEKINYYTKLQIRLEVQRPSRGKALFIFHKGARKEISSNIEANNESLSTNNRDKLLKDALALLSSKRASQEVIQDLLAKSLDKHDFDYVNRNIHYTNQFASSNYLIYLIKALENDWAYYWWKEQEELKNLDTEKEEKQEDLFESKKYNIRPGHFATEDEAINWLKERLELEGKMYCFDLLENKVKLGYAGNLISGGYSRQTMEYFIFEMR